MTSGDGVRFSILSSRARGLWAKSGELPGHPLIAHCLDVSATCHAILTREPASTQHWAARALGLADSQLVAWLSALCGLHDFGKAIPGFQSKWPEGKKFLESQGLPFPPSACGRSAHDLATAALLNKALGVHANVDPICLKQMVQAVSAHHGHHWLPTEISEGKPLNEPGTWGEARTELLECYWRVVAPQGRPAQDELALPVVNWLAGLTSSADWIASNTDWFPLGLRGFDDLREYHAHALELAREALQQIGWHGSHSLLRQDATTNELLAKILACETISARPLQEVGDRLLRAAQGPTLLLVEAPMGEGKTELAFLAHLRLQAANQHRGLYVALPTQATGNALFERALTFLKQFSAGPVDVQLVHGGAAMNENMQRLRAVHLRGIAHSDHESLAASSWFAQRKRPLLSAYGVGTVDQALYAVLNVKHHFVRLWGLSNRVVVLDEVHAYDTYTSGLIAALLRWLKAMNCSVVLMSATLPQERRNELLAAWGVASGTHPHAPYPRVMLADARGIHVEHFAARTLVPIQLFGLDESLDGLADKALELLADVGCGALIVNTVDRAQKLFTALRARLDETVSLLLFHARFPADERVAREREVLAAFGSGGQRPPRALMVATQVAEQSLDIDFDFMISDLAPVDLLLQRSGRLHRHTRSRPVQHSHPRLWIAGLAQGRLPELKETAWGHVYDKYILLRTWALLGKEAELHLPRDIDRLVQAVYGDEALPEDIGQEIWQQIEIESLGEYLARIQKERRESFNIAIDPTQEIGSAYANKPRGSEEGEGLGLENKTRLGQESITLIPVEVIDDQWRASPGASPFSPDQPLNDAIARRLYDRQLKVSRQGVVTHFKAQPLPAAFEHPLLRNCHPLPLTEGGYSQASLFLRLDEALGLIYETADRSDKEKA